MAQPERSTIHRPEIKLVAGLDQRSIYDLAEKTHAKVYPAAVEEDGKGTPGIIQLAYSRGDFVEFYMAQSAAIAHHVEVRLGSTTPPAGIKGTETAIFTKDDRLVVVEYRRDKITPTLKIITISSSGEESSYQRFPLSLKGDEPKVDEDILRALEIINQKHKTEQSLLGRILNRVAPY